VIWICLLIGSYSRGICSMLMQSSTKKGLQIGGKDVSLSDEPSPIGRDTADLPCSLPRTLSSYRSACISAYCMYSLFLILKDAPGQKHSWGSCQKDVASIVTLHCNCVMQPRIASNYQNLLSTRQLQISLQISHPSPTRLKTLGCIGSINPKTLRE